MKKKHSTLSIIALIVLCTLCALSVHLSVPVSAAAVSAFIDVDSYVEADSEFALTVRFEADAEILVNAELTYDSSAVSFVRSSSTDINNIGGTVKILTTSFATTQKFTLYFKMKGASKAYFSVTLNESFTIDMESFGTAFAERTVTGFHPTPAPETPTLPPPTATPTPTPTPFVPTVDPDATPSNALEFMDNGTMRFIAENFNDSDVTLPEGYERFQYTFKDYSISAFKNKYGIILIYATDIIGQNGSLYIYNDQKDIITPYHKWAGAGEEYTFLIYTGKLPDGFTESSLSISDDINVTAYTIPSDIYSDFMLLYAYTGENEPQFYLFDTKEKTIQRFVDVNNILMLSSESSQSPDTASYPPDSHTPSAPAHLTDNDIHTSNSGVTDNLFGLNRRALIYSFIAMCVTAFIAAVIIIAVKTRRINEDWNEANESDKSSRQYSPEAVTETAGADITGNESCTDDSDDSNKPDATNKPDDSNKSSDDDSNNKPDDEILQLRNDFTR